MAGNGTVGTTCCQTLAASGDLSSISYRQSLFRQPVHLYSDERSGSASVKEILSIVKIYTRIPAYGDTLIPVSKSQSNQTFILQCSPVNRAPLGPAKNWSNKRTDWLASLFY